MSRSAGETINVKSQTIINVNCNKRTVKKLCLTADSILLIKFHEQYSHQTYKNVNSCEMLEQQHADLDNAAVFCALPSCSLCWMISSVEVWKAECWFERQFESIFSHTECSRKTEVRAIWSEEDQPGCRLMWDFHWCWQIKNYQGASVKWVE